MKYVKHRVLEKTSDDDDDDENDDDDDDDDDDDEFKNKYGAEKDKVLYDAELFKICRGRDTISYNEYDGSKSTTTTKFF
jgi:hypothetical protein